MAKVEQPGKTISITAAAAITKGYFIGLDGNVCAAAARAAGVSGADTGSGNQIPVVTDGIVVMAAGAAITVTTAPVAVEVDATGLPVTKAAGVQCGWALDNAAAAGDEIRVLLA